MAKRGHGGRRRGLESRGSLAVVFPAGQTLCMHTVHRRVSSGLAGPHRTLRTREVARPRNQSGCSHRATSRRGGIQSLCFGSVLHLLYGSYCKMEVATSVCRPDPRRAQRRGIMVHASSQKPQRDLAPSHSILNSLSAGGGCRAVPSPRRDTVAPASFLQTLVV
jgi:hypothetical protein